jgi:hypothetical protein
MTACVNCARALQPAWKYCIFCGTRTAVAAAAPRSRPLPGPASSSGGSRRASAPARTPVPAQLSSASTAQTPVIPVGAPAPLAAAPSTSPVSSDWPDDRGERPTPGSQLATDVPAPTPPAAEVPAPDDGDDASGEEIVEEAPRKQGKTGVSILDLVAEEPEANGKRARKPRRKRGRPSRAEPLPVAETDVEADVEPETVAEPDAEAEPEAQPESEEPEAETETLADEDVDVDADDGAESDTETDAIAAAEPVPEAPNVTDPRTDRVGRVNLLAVLALLLGVLASPLAALFGHVALGQVRATGERGVIPAWIAIVLGYLWLGFFLVLGITYLATNG